ncbi:MAG: methyltransferase domain-containing protein [Myxococcales bacterium]|nr:methyltransferase domain-containing protein [Myxococcales bacterium]
MKLSELAAREPLAPWKNAPGIPWDEPEFSARMLREHLSQDHDAASRRFARIDRHVAWLHDQVIPRTRGSVLDLGCGPGLYTSRLAQRGHRCFGVDISPASIEHARGEVADAGLGCSYMRADFRSAPLGAGHGAALLLYGQWNALRREEATALLGKIREALTGGGVLVLEVHTENAIESRGREGPIWYPSAGGLLAEGDHLVLQESGWHEDVRAATRRWFAVDAETAEVSVYGETHEAWSDEEYRDALTTAGFTEIQRAPSLTGKKDRDQKDLFVLTAVRG